MSISAFTDKQHSPTLDEVLAAVGAARAAWDRVTDFIAANYTTTQEFKYYGKSLGWALRFRKSGKALLSLYAARDAFTAQIVLGSAEVERALALDLTPKVRQIIDAAIPYPEGRWLFIPVESDADLADVERLVLLKAPPSHRARRDSRCPPALSTQIGCPNLHHG